MANSQFEAKTFGVGQLISQRKSFKVPAHQRSYAWTKDAVQEFLADIENALAKGEGDYFLGLVVLQAAPNGQWILLDGQQRLTTVSLVYSALRRWLYQKGYDDDARQIDHEFIGIRRLGGEYSSRMILNEENRRTYSAIAQDDVHDNQLAQLKKAGPKGGSNHLLVDAALACREWVAAIAEPEEIRGADDVYALATFLESRLKVVAVEVMDDVDAYVLFESLNDRGIALSALDLIKNYILGKDPGQANDWSSFVAMLGGINHDDFLKVFWTSRRGLISKSRIFKGVKELYGQEADARILLDELRTDARILSALSDEEDPFWESFPDKTRALVFLLQTMDSKQVRAVLVAILREYSDLVLANRCIWLVCVAIVRFQVIGKGRTGVIEKVIGRVCSGVTQGTIKTAADFQRELSELMIDDHIFRDSFRKHSDKKFGRVASLLAIDFSSNINDDGAVVNLQMARDVALDARLSMPIRGPDGHELSNSIGNFRLIVQGTTFADSNSDEGPSIADHDALSYISARSDHLAARAVRIWSGEAEV